MSRGAGGTGGGVGQFLLGFVMMSGGFYMLLNAIRVTSSYGMGHSLYRMNAMGGFNITGGMVMIPFIFGVGILFYNGKNMIGWLLTLGSLTAMIFGVISSINFSMRSMSAFDLIVIFILAFGGLGLFLRSMHDYDRDAIDDRPRRRRGR